MVGRASHLHTLTQSLTQAAKLNALQLFNLDQTTLKHHTTDDGIVLENRLQQGPGLNESSITHTEQTEVPLLSIKSIYNILLLTCIKVGAQVLMDSFLAI